MGSFIKALQKQHQPKKGHEFFAGNSLTKLREYYSLFKSISETYSIDTQQFLQLFGNKHDQVFDLLDTDRNLLIDGLQLFAGLILLSYNIKFQDKVGFLFELFDFNDLKSLSRTDIEFLFLSCCNAVVKVFGVKPPQDDSFIEEFVREEFPTDERVNISEMHKWARRSEAVSRFFQHIVEPLQNERVVQAQKIYLQHISSESQYGFVDSHQQQQQEKFMLKSQKLFNKGEETERQVRNCFDISPQMSWVYGIRFRDVKQFIEYISTSSEELLLYFVGKVAVIYNIKSQRQKHYTGHTLPIISIAVEGTLCATGDFGLSPEIRIWDYRSLETVQILRGDHVKGVHLVKFIAGGLLVSCGCLEQSPVIIFDIETGQALFRTYCCSPAVQISLLCNFTNRPAQEFIIVSLYSVYHFECLAPLDNSQKVSLKVSRMYEKQQPTSCITTCCFFMINQCYRHLSQYEEHFEKQVMTGHQNGVVYVWNLAKNEREYSFSQQMNAVVRLLPTHNHLLVVTSSSFLAYYNIHLQDRQRIRSIDVTQVDQQLRSYDVSQCLICGKEQLLMVTKRADIFFLSEHQPPQLPVLTHFTHRKYHTRLVDQILFVEGRINQHRLVSHDKEQILYVAVEHAIFAIDLQTHKYIKEWNIGERVVSFDAAFIKGTGLFVVAATEGNRLYSFTNTTENITRQNIETQIISVLIHHQDSPTSILVLVSTKDSIIKYGVVRSNFVNANPYSFAGLTATLSPFQGNKILVSGEDNSLKMLLVKQMHAQNLSEVDYKTSSPVLKIHFHIPLGSYQLRLPVLVGLRSKVLVAARRDGRIYLWSGFQELVNRTPLILTAHTSSISDLVITDDQRELISSGSTDGMIIQWHIRYFLQPGSAVTVTRLREQKIESVPDELAVRRIDYCKFENNLLGKLYDQHLQVKGIKSQTIRRLFKSNFSDWKVQNAMVRAEESPIHLRLDFTFGIQTFHKNNTVIALSQPKRFLYFISKLLVIYNPALNTQTFYRGHKFKVTCLVLLDNETVASGEAAYRPTIHIWNTTSLETERIIQTGHRWGIVELAAKDYKLVSWGLRYIRDEMDAGKEESFCQYNIYSYQVTDCRNGNVVAQREDKDLVHSLAIDPRHPNRFASCNDGRVVFWQVRSNTILRRKVCWLNGDTPTSCVYYFSGSGQADLLVGTRAGSLGMVSRCEHWHVFMKDEKDGHPINCLLVVPHQQEILIVVASEGNYLRILNHKFQERFFEDMSKIDLTEEGSKRVWQGKGEKLQRNCSIQSLSQVEIKGEFRILLGTRNGEVLELVQSKDYNRYSNKEMNFKAVLFLRFNMAQAQIKGRNKVFTAHHPTQQILASIGMDQQLLFWDCQRRRLLHSAYLGLDRQKSYPTALKFNHNGEYLIVGYSDGLLVFLDSKISKGKADNKYSPPTLNMLKKDKAQQGHAVINIELSENGSFLAVSYHKLTADRSHAYIQIFQNRFKDKPRNYARFQNQKIFEHFSTVPCPHTEKAYPGEDGVMHGFAAYSMAFAESENKHYFLIYFQILDENQNRLAISSEGDEERNYKVWDVSSSTVIANSALIESIKWKKMYIHNAIEAHYLLHEPHLIPVQPTDTPPSNNNLLLPEFTNMTLLSQHLVAVSLNGDLHVVRLSALEGQANGLVGKTMPGHSCKINQIESNHEKTVLYTSGESDECILKWVVEESSSLIVGEDFQQDEKDLFGEVFGREEMKQQLELWQSKFRIGNKIVRNINFIDPLKVIDVLGRRAEQVRNNLKYDHFGRIIFSSGHTALIVDSNHNKEFIYIKDDPSYIMQEITALEVSRDGQFLFTCHAGSRVGVVQWQLSSKSLQKRLQFQEIAYVLMVAVSDDMSRLVLYGLTVEAIAQVLFVDLNTGQQLAVCSYTHKQPWHVKSISFVPDSHDRFVSCGIEHSKYWQFMGGQLVYSNLPGADSSRINTCLAFVGEELVTGNDFGQLVVWQSEPIMRQEHQNIITCLAVHLNGKEWFITTGSLNSQNCDFQVVLWSYLHSDLTTLHKINLALEASPAALFSSRLTTVHKQRDIEVQSLFMNAKNVLIGTGRGDVYEYNYDWAVKRAKPAEHLLKQMFVYEDGQQTKAMFFTASEEQLVQISEMGLLRIWGLPNATLHWSYNFDLQAINMIYSQKYELIIIAFKGELRFFRWVVEAGKQSLFQIEQNYRQFFYITHLILSHNQKFVALGIERNSDKVNLIQLYEVSQKQFTFKLRLNLDSPVLFVDFNRLTSDKAFMLVSTRQKIELFDLIHGVSAPLDLVKRIDWMGDGLLLSERTDVIRCLHEEQMHLGVIKKILQVEGFLVLDSLGGVHWYQDNRLWATCSLNISSIDCFCLSSSMKWLAVGSKIDRNVVILQLGQSKQK